MLHDFMVKSLALVASVNGLLRFFLSKCSLRHWAKTLEHSFHDNSADIPYTLCYRSHIGCLYIEHIFKIVNHHSSF